MRAFINFIKKAFPGNKVHEAAESALRREAADAQYAVDMREIRARLARIEQCLSLPVGNAAR